MQMRCLGEMPIFPLMPQKHPAPKSVGDASCGRVEVGEGRGGGGEGERSKRGVVCNRGENNADKIDG